MLVQQTELSIEKFLEILSTKQKVYFVLDYDGTLVPFNKENHEAYLKDEDFQIINQLAQTPDTKVAILTGRSLNGIKRLLGDNLIPEIDIYGTHGAEKNIEATDSPYREQLNAIQAKFSQEPHIAFEEKPLSITIHYRDHPDRPALTAKLDAEAELYQDIFRIQKGHDVYEFLPKEINKGNAIQEISEEHQGYYLVFLGDDLTDNYGFSTINSLGGLPIQVDRRIKDPVAGYFINRIEDSYNLMKAYIKAHGTN